MEITNKQRISYGYWGIPVALVMLASLVLGVATSTPILTAVITSIGLVGLVLHLRMGVRIGAHGIGSYWIALVWGFITVWDILQAVGVIPVG